MKKIYISLILFQMVVLNLAILREELGKDLPTNANNYDITARRIIRPFGGNSGSTGSGCNFNGIRGGKPKAQGSGRTFFDLQFLNVGYYHTYNINCEGGGSHPMASGSGLGGHKPILGGHESGGGTQGGIFSNKPSKPILSMILANRPLQGLFSQSQSQSQTQTQTGLLADTISSFTSLLPKPQDIGQGLGDGISSFIQTIPQIGQSFQSLLPSFENFQLPSLPPLAQGSQSMAVSGSRPPVTSPPVAVTPAAPDPVTEPTVDPDDIIYNDDVKPVNEDTDVAGPGQGYNKLPPGGFYKGSNAQNRYNIYKNYQQQKISSEANRNKFHYQQTRPYYGYREPRYRQNLDIFRENERDSPYSHEGREESRPFRFPT